MSQKSGFLIVSNVFFIKNVGHKVQKSDKSEQAIFSMLSIR